MDVITVLSIMKDIVKNSLVPLIADEQSDD